MPNYTPMIQQYLSIKANYQDAFLFFRLGDFYEMFFEDAVRASKVLEITLTGRDGGVGEKIPMCGIPYHSAEPYITKLLENGYKVAICEQVEDPSEAKGVVKREVVRMITPGTVMAGKLLDNKGNNYIASIILDHNLLHIGFSISDISTGEFYATEIQGEFESVITEISQYQPSEIVIDKELYERNDLILQQINTTITIVEKDTLFSEENYEKLTKEQFINLDINKLPKSIIYSSGQLLTYLQKTQQKKITHINELSIYNAKQFMVLDAFSKRNLELVHTSRELTKKGSLLWLLDKTETSMGSRLLRRWLEKPLLSSNGIENRLNNVEELSNNLFLAEDLRDQLDQIYDIERLISKVSFENASPRDLYHLRKSIERVPEIYQLIIDSNAESLNSLVKGIDQCQDIASLIEESIQDEPPISPKDGDFIKRGYNKQLDDYYIASTDGKEWLRNLELKEKERTGIKFLKIGFNKVFGYYIEVRKSSLSLVPSDRYFRKQTLANAERYITEELKDKETIILEAEDKKLDLEYQVFTKVREDIAVESYRLQHLAQQIAKLDVLLSFATISNKYNYSRPNINHEGKIIIEEGRHPVIEAVHNKKPFIPNSTQLDQEKNQILMITGPNMAGKSTYMRQIAIISIMAQIGCFVPAKSASLPIIDRIFTRIGAGDDLTSGQSTFMVEMIETRQAITQATPNSLILLDEIGRGTSTYDGMALAQAVIQYIHEKVKAKTLFSTHYHELTILADSFQRIENVHVNVIERDGKVIFLHKIEKGKADRSYGIHVAELAEMPIEVIEDAKKILQILESQDSKKNNNQIQMELFDTDENPSKKDKVKESKASEKEKIAMEIATEIKDLDLLNLTPMDGFQILYDIHKRLRG